VRIAFLSWESLHSVYAGGIAEVVTKLAAALERKGNEVHVFTRAGPGQKSYEMIDGVHYHRCTYKHEKYIIDDMRNMSKALAHMFFETENIAGHFDIIHAHDWMVTPAVDEIKNQRNKKVVFTLHSTQFGRDGNRFYNGTPESIKGVEWYGTFIAERVIVNSDTMIKEGMWLHKIPRDKIKLVPNAVNCEEYDGFIDPKDVKEKYGIPFMDPMILFVGRMTYMKGPDLLLEAIPKVLEQIPNAKFVFMGDGDMMDYVKEGTKELGLERAVRFTGFLRGQDKHDLFKACDCLVVPSRNEPFGIVTLEAWSAGKPVIAMHGTGSGDLVWHNVTGLQVFRNPDSIAWGVTHLFSDYEKARWMGNNGRHAVETVFTWDNMADKTLEVYNEIL
jgi:glycosyltransferase involved in cell wall biosynthesis